MSRSRSFLVVGMVIMSLAAGLGIAEIAVRAAGRKPWRSQPSDEPVMMEPDPILGWRPIPGRRYFGPYSPGAEAVQMTTLSDRSRDTGAGADAGRPELVLIGCSYTMGYAVSDDQTFAWGLQRIRPDLHVINHGVGGYGTFQSLLLLEQLLRSGERPAHVIYGYILTHEMRNVADPVWLYSLAVGSISGMVAVPYCSLNGTGDLVRQPPRAYPAWPLRDSLAAVTLLQDRYANLRDRRRAAMGFGVTLHLMVEMDRLCRAHGVRFSVLVLMRGKGGPWRYQAALEQQGVDIIDECHLDFGYKPAVPGAGHPNAEAHARWAACLARALQRRSSPRQAAGG